MTNYQHDIEKYLKGELTPAERHALEKKALSDPFLADALEGAESIHNDVFSKDVEELNKKITNQKEATFWTWSLRIAAGVTIVLASTYIVWQTIQPKQETKELALEKNKPTIPQPSVKDSISQGELSAEQTEKAEGPALKDKAVASKPIIKVVPKEEALAQQPETSGPPAKTDADMVEELKAEEVKAEEAIAQTKAVEKEALDEAVKYKSADVQRSKKLSLAKDDQRKEAAPATTDGRSAGAASITSKTIRGKVTSAEDGSGLPGVNVIIKGSTIGTVTDEGGNYEIDVNYSNTTLVYSFIGLQSKELNAGDRTELDVALSLDATQLSEVVVTGYSSGSGESNMPPTVDMTHPSAGYRAFKQYLQQNIRYPEIARLNKVEGRVTVEFTVETNGTLSNFRIIRGIGSGCDDELIRLIKEGPQWMPTKKDGVPVQDKAKVRLKFELPK